MEALRLLIVAILASLALGVDYAKKALNISNPTVDISSCQALSCHPSNKSICSLEDYPTTYEQGIGIAPHAVNVSSTMLSYTLIDGFNAADFTGISIEEYGFSDEQLFVGMDPNAKDLPFGCALMLQYQGQTFPAETWPGTPTSPRAEKSYLKNTTSCLGVLDPFCQQALVEEVRSFHGAGSNISESHRTETCEQLAQHVRNQLLGPWYQCGGGGGGTWISSFINVTGGALPGPKTPKASSSPLGKPSCRPVLPPTYDLYHVGAMREFYLIDPPNPGSRYYDRVFGGRAGFTPIITALYNNGSGEPEVQLTCMKTFQPNGKALSDAFGAGERPKAKIAISILFPLSLCLLVTLI